MLGLDNCLLVSVQAFTGIALGLPTWGEVTLHGVRIAHSTARTLFAGSTNANQLAFNSLGRLYIGVAAVGGWGKIKRGDKLNLTPDERVPRSYLAAYIWEHAGPKGTRDALSHYEVEICDTEFDLWDLGYGAPPVEIP